MKPEFWKIYDKRGFNLNLSSDSYINMIFSTNVGKDAEGYIITDPSLNIIRTFITNRGQGYDANTEIYLDYTFNSTGVPYHVDASIYYSDVSVFNPEPNNSKSISSVIISDNSNYIYPSVTYAGAIFLDPVSKGLIETEHLTIIQESSNGYVSPYDSSNSTLVFKMIGDETQIQLFTVDTYLQEVIWADEIVYDVSNYVINQGIQINIGFHSDEEGIYERRLCAYHKIGETYFPLLEIVVNAQSIGEDERFDTLLDNFGLFKPKEIQSLFKEADINESLPDWKLLNYKAKHLILEHNKIVPYIGTYKALINAIKWLGYEDIQIKEWFKNVKENKLLSLYVSYNAEERKKTIKYFSPEERQHLKKLNQLSLIYCITRETGEIDDWGNPLTENCYEYNIDEIFTKLYSLKTWLEKNIIGINTRICDITGEGVYFERFQNFIYGFQNNGCNANYEQSLTPITLTSNSELIKGDTSILLSLKEFENLTINDFENYRIIDFARCGWDPSNGLFSPEQYDSLSYKDPSTVFMGSTFLYPFADLYDIQWNLLLEKEYGVVTKDFVTNPLFIYENKIIFYNIFDLSTSFFDISTNVDVTIENGYLRDPSIDIWADSLMYTIYPQEASGDYTGKWILESSSGNKYYTWNEFSLQTSVSPLLTYSYDDNYMVPLFKIKGYKWTDSSGVSHDLPKTFILDIVDGKISMNTTKIGFKGETVSIENYINFNYDTSLAEQKITLNVVYSSPRIPLFSINPSDASLLYYNPDASITLLDDNSTYKIGVNHTGNYNIEIYGWNSQNNLFFNYVEDDYNVWQKYPIINAYIDTSCAGNIEYSCVSTYLTTLEVSILIDQNKYPLFDRIFALQGLTLEYNNDIEKYFIKVPSITYFQDLPESNSICKFYNLTEKILDISINYISIDPDYQWFVVGDSVNIVKFDKGKYSFIQETSSLIIGANIIGGFYNYWLDSVPNNFKIDPSYEWYLLNNTEREIYNPINDISNRTFTCDISTGYADYAFKINQLVSIIIIDLSTGLSWGASIRVLDVSSYSDNYGTRHVFSGNVPNFVLNDPYKYELRAKHAFSTFSEFEIINNYAIEDDNNFNLYLNDIYYHQYCLDNTFVFLNITFNHEDVIAQWYDVSDNLINNKQFYSFDHSIELDISTLVIFKTNYDSSDYMLNQKNIWEIKNRDDESLLMRVNNFSVPYIFNKTGTYDVTVEAYDNYGNLKKQTFEGLIIIK